MEIFLAEKNIFMFIPRNKYYYFANGVLLISEMEGKDIQVQEDITYVSTFCCQV